MMHRNKLATADTHICTAKIRNSYLSREKRSHEEGKFSKLHSQFSSYFHLGAEEVVAFFFKHSYSILPFLPQIIISPYDSQLHFIYVEQ